MIVSLTYLSLIHVHRIYFDYGSYSLDITGPLMIITQKVTLLTFSIHDGIAREEAELTKSQKVYAVRKLPSALEYFSYVLHFQGLMCGPVVVYKDYIEFINGTNILKHSAGNGNLDTNGKPIVVEPSPVKAVVKKVIGSVICAYIFMNWVKVYPIKTLSGKLISIFVRFRFTYQAFDFQFDRGRLHREHIVPVQDMVHDDGDHGRSLQILSRLVVGRRHLQQLRIRFQWIREWWQPQVEYDFEHKCDIVWGTHDQMAMCSSSGK